MLRTKSFIFYETVFREKFIMETSRKEWNYLISRTIPDIDDLNFSMHLHELKLY